MLYLPRLKCSKFFAIFRQKRTNLTYFFSVCLKRRLMVLRNVIHFLVAVTTKYIVKNSDNSNIISYFTQESILELQYTKKGLQEVRNLVYFSYILVKLTFFREILTLIKIRECLRPSADIDLAFFPFLRFFLVLFQLIRYLILIFSNIYYFLSKIN